MNSTIEKNTADLSMLQIAWEGIRKAKPGIRIREAAQQLGCSEAVLLATSVNDYTTRLEGDWTQLFRRLPQLGRVMSLTRNESCVLEHKGSFQKIDVMGTLPQAMATVIGPIETRVFFSAWTFGFAVRQETPHGLQQSLQFFDASGTAITKIFMQGASGNRAGSDQAAFDRIVEDFKAADQSRYLETRTLPEPETKPACDIDAAALLIDWACMKDTHDFFGMLKKHKVHRLDALQIARDKFTYGISNSSLRHLLESAASGKLPIMIFAGNRGNLQIHQGKIQTVRIMDMWLNILDPDFNMHLREDHVHTAWVVRKPTSDGVVTGVEVFDKDKNMIVQFFGLRKPGIPELETWRKLVDELPRLER